MCLQQMHMPVFVNINIHITESKEKASFVNKLHRHEKHSLVTIVIANEWLDLSLEALKTYKICKIFEVTIPAPKWLYASPFPRYGNTHLSTPMVILPLRETSWLQCPGMWQNARTPGKSALTLAVTCSCILATATPVSEKTYHCLKIGSIPSDFTLAAIMPSSSQFEKCICKRG